MRDCFCDLTEWSDWGRCNALENGCGDGKKTRSRSSVESDYRCEIKEGDQLEEERNCFTKHCTNEFYKMKKITVQVLEAEYPGQNGRFNFRQ